MANPTGTVTPVPVPHAWAPPWGRARQLQPHKEGEQRSSVRRQRRDCAGAGGAHKRQETPRKVWHNGVGNENFALGFPRIHPMGEMGRGGISRFGAKSWETGWHSSVTGGKVTPPPPQKKNPPSDGFLPPFWGSFLVAQLFGESYPVLGGCCGFLKSLSIHSIFRPPLHPIPAPSGV